ncbi:MAG TPA: type II 3-dehydroquinate dehydratase [Clostridia bacterium]|nr:type II 3-dehydroquinate dehydratase [Clostridia bacterium]
MKILVINGVNLNMLGIREINLYGQNTYKDLEEYIKKEADKLNIEVSVYQSNFEGEIVTAIQNAYKVYDGIIINAGAYTHTSIAILDALKAVAIPTVEVHLTDIKNREEFRQLSYISYVAKKIICGKGFAGYKEAMQYFAK